MLESKYQKFLKEYVISYQSAPAFSVFVLAAKLFFSDEKSRRWRRKVQPKRNIIYIIFPPLTLTCPPAVPLTAEWTPPRASTQHGRSLSSAALLQPPQVLMPARAPRAKTGPKRAKLGQDGTEPISLKLWRWTTQDSSSESNYLKPVPLHLSHEDTGASLWSFSLSQGYSP